MPPSTRPGEPRSGQDAYARLVAEIRAGRLRPLDRLTETDLAARLGISRTPVREALRQMEAEGLVTHIPRVGATIRALDYSEVNELYEMRAVLEGTAARLAARAASDVETSELAAINEEMTAALGDPERLVTLNAQFHTALIEAASNRFLVRAVESVRKTMLILGPTTMEDDERASSACAEHAEILAALFARDGAAAEAAMRRHIGAAHGVRLRQLRARAAANPPGAGSG